MLVGTDADAAMLLRGAARGDRGSWEALIARFDGLVRKVARAEGMSLVDAADVSQTTWLRLTENLDRIEHPERLGAWLVTTTRRECVRQRKLQRRQVPIAEVATNAETGQPPSVESRLLTDEQIVVVQRAFARLPGQSRTLLLLLMRDPPMSYVQISQALGMPIGSVGPTRGRALSLLRRELTSTGIWPTG